jgi:hypothetical protein
MLRRIRQATLEGPLTIRTSRTDDDGALERLAALEGRGLPKGPFLLAEVGGELVAAAPLELDAPPLGNPFRPTADLCELLALRARQLRRRDGAVPRWTAAGAEPLADAA